MIAKRLTISWRIILQCSHHVKNDLKRPENGKKSYLKKVFQNFPPGGGFLRTPQRNEPLRPSSSTGKFWKRRLFTYCSFSFYLLSWTCPKFSAQFIFFSSLGTWRPEPNIKIIERFLSSCVVRYSENSAWPEIGFEPNRGEIVYYKFFQIKAVWAESSWQWRW